MNTGRAWTGLDSNIARRLGALWGKSAEKGGGRTNLLLAHLLDTAAVAELMWDRYLAESTKRALDGVAGGRGRGRQFFAWLCGIHDCGKATPAFQRIDEKNSARVRSTGLTWTGAKSRKWRHDRAGGRLIQDVLGKAGWGEKQISWIWPLVAGHHGRIPSSAECREPKHAPMGNLYGKGPAWREAQRAMVESFTLELGYEDLLAVQPTEMPNRALQLQFSGLIVMADWIASDERHFSGIDDLADVSLRASRVRAAWAWDELGLRGGWSRLGLPGPEVFQDRFGQSPRPSQTMVMEAAHRMRQPGLLIVEAPMGEGKTKSALVAAEILAARFGADGVFIGMPTQATSDPIFSQVRSWAAEVLPGLESQVALLHGKHRFNKKWRSLLETAGESPDDLYGTVDQDAQYGISPDPDCCDQERHAPAEWFLGNKRGLLVPFVVGTIDQLLMAATRTKHVMLRMAGLVGKVVILDEVHAADVYMSEFLKEGLRWLGQAGVPVIMLSATLPPDQRKALTDAYLAGALSREEPPEFELPAPLGYPNVTAACITDGMPQVFVDHSLSWRPDLTVRLEVLDEDDATDRDPHSAVSELLEERLHDGGCALVIRNTVDRAQDTYQELLSRFGPEEVALLHGRLHAADRADRTEEALKDLGPSTLPRPRRVLVATQLAEQSFDVDADLLITDLAPIDLLLQRIGRLHRHNGVPRPEAVREPCVVVTGFSGRSEEAPWILPAGKAIYGAHPLLRTAALVLESADLSWQIPGQVPSLVAAVYGEERITPETWRSAEDDAREEWDEDRRKRTANAQQYILTGIGGHEKKTLESLHYYDSPGTEEVTKAIVRDGEPSLEVILVRKKETGYHSVNGRFLSQDGGVHPDRLDDLLAGTVRLPAKFTPAAEKELKPLPAWRDDPWLRHSRALCLDPQGHTTLNDALVRYDPALGLVISRSIQ